MHILKFILKLLRWYVLFCFVDIFILLIISKFIDVENMAWRVYDYLHFHYDLYGDVYQYDINPVLGDFLIAWIILSPFIIAFIYFRIIKNITKRCKFNSAN